MVALTAKQQEQAAKTFAAKWAGRGDEKQETARFWSDLLQNVYGIENPSDYLEFEKRVQLEHVSYIDVYIPKTSTVIEQKSIGKSLDEGIRQSDGTVLTPVEQAKRYAASLPYSERPRWVISCNFKEFKIIDMERPNDTPQVMKLADLPKEYYRLNFMVDEKDSHIEREMEISRNAGELVGKLYQALLEQYKQSNQLSEDEMLQNLNKLCVRLVFCMYAEDAGLFGKKNLFHDYIEQSTPQRLGRDLRDLFRILDMEETSRDPYEEEMLAAFPYVNGNLFGEAIVIPNFSEEAFHLLLNEACNFDWAQISPTIFGAIFESTLNPDTRRHGGMHYTSIENIHKVIDPLFLNEYREKFNEIMTIKTIKTRLTKLKNLQKELASLTFLDPAAGSGNFLTESYLSLRRLENDILRETITDKSGTGVLGFEEEEFNPIQVTIQQFYGIEINDFAVSVAKTAIWIAEAQMFKETEAIIHKEMDFLPLHTNANIHEGNALQMDWNDVIPASELSYIMGNPPFVGYSLQSKEQKKDMLAIYVDEKGKSYKTAGKIDYVAGWFFKAAQMMQHTSIRTAFVSTNSITQGEQVAGVWKPLYERFGIHIDFAWRTFKWNSESTNQAAVHCVIVGFSSAVTKKEKIIYNDKGYINKCAVVSPYLIEMNPTFILPRKKQISDAPKILKGNIPVDNGNLIIEEDVYKQLKKNNDFAVTFIKPLLGAKEYIQNKKRYCLWLVDATPTDIKKSKFLIERIRACREFRLKSSKAATRKFAEIPHLFMENRQPIAGKYILVPLHSSENRRYVPMGFFGVDMISTNANSIIPDATLYHFGILTSNVHMSWMRLVCGRIKSDYRYSNDIVYNNFPWPTPTAKQKERIEKTAQGILDARALYPNGSLADLYDPSLMPKKLLYAHRANDKAVMDAYGFSTAMTEEDCVAELMKRYEALVHNEQ